MDDPIYPEGSVAANTASLSQSAFTVTSQWDKDTEEKR